MVLTVFFLSLFAIVTCPPVFLSPSIIHAERSTACLCSNRSFTRQVRTRKRKDDYIFHSRSFSFTSIYLHYLRRHCWTRSSELALPPMRVYPPLRHLAADSISTHEYAVSSSSFPLHVMCVCVCVWRSLLSFCSTFSLSRCVAFKVSSLSTDVNPFSRSRLCERQLAHGLFSFSRARGSTKKTIRRPKEKREKGQNERTSLSVRRTELTNVMPHIAAQLSIQRSHTRVRHSLSSF